MPITIEAIADAAAKAALCLDIAAELPLWFGRPDSNARYAAGMAARDAFAALIEGTPRGLIALEYHFGVTCNIWWLGVSAASHGQGLGRALVDRAVVEARARGCRQMAVETMSPRANSREYDLTRRFYEAAGFTPFVEFEPEPGDYMMWMLRGL
jgi:ribosomal protein S18 acetylase RimI-like enzyme